MATMNMNQFNLKLHPAVVGTHAKSAVALMRHETTRHAVLPTSTFHLHMKPGAVIPTQHNYLTIAKFLLVKERRILQQSVPQMIARVQIAKSKASKLRDIPSVSSLLHISNFNLRQERKL